MVFPETLISCSLLKQNKLIFHSSKVEKRLYRSIKINSRLAEFFQLQLNEIDIFRQLEVDCPTYLKADKRPRFGGQTFHPQRQKYPKQFQNIRQKGHTESSLKNVVVLVVLNHFMGV